MKEIKILYISGTRADYGLMRSTLSAIKRNTRLRLEVIATGMHVMPGFGLTLREILKDNLKVHVIKTAYDKDNKSSVVLFMSKFMQSLLGKIKAIRPDIILLLGDRPEMLASAIVGVYLSIPIAHIHGGEVTSTVDEFARHAITKLSSLHFAATTLSSKRILKMGEPPSRVFVVGAPGLDSILSGESTLPGEIAEKYKLDLSKKIILVIQHSVTMEIPLAAKQMRQTMEAIKELKCQSIIIYPNADPGSSGIIKAINKYRQYPYMRIYKNIPRADYLGLMKVADAMVGNSSSGIIEASSFALPVVNIGSRQRNRERSTNVIDVSYNKDKIKDAIKKAIYNKAFISRVRKCKNPYGDGKAALRIAGVLSKIKLGRDFLEKQLTY